MTAEEGATGSQHEADINTSEAHQDQAVKEHLIRQIMYGDYLVDGEEMSSQVDADPPEPNNYPKTIVSDTHAEQDPVLGAFNTHFEEVQNHEGQASFDPRKYPTDNCVRDAISGIRHGSGRFMMSGALKQDRKPFFNHLQLGWSSNNEEAEVPVTFTFDDALVDTNEEEAQSGEFQAHQETEEWKADLPAFDAQIEEIEHRKRQASNEPSRFPVDDESDIGAPDNQPHTHPRFLKSKGISDKNCATRVGKDGFPDEGIEADALSLGLVEVPLSLQYRESQTAPGGTSNDDASSLIPPSNELNISTITIQAPESEDEEDDEGDTSLSSITEAINLSVKTARQMTLFSESEDDSSESAEDSIETDEDLPEADEDIDKAKEDDGEAEENLAEAENDPWDAESRSETFDLAPMDDVANANVYHPEPQPHYCKMSTEASGLRM